MTPPHTDEISASETLPLKGVRIARISTVAFFVVSQLSYQLKYLIKQGAEVTVITSNSSDVEHLKEIEGLNCELIEIPRSISVWQDAKALIALFWFFKRNRFDIVHSTTPKAGLLSAIASRLAGIPIRLHTFTGQPWVSLAGVRRSVVKFCDEIIGKLNTLNYADSFSQCDFLISQKLLTKSKLMVLGSGSLSGVDTLRFDKRVFTPESCTHLRKDLGIGMCDPVILFIGRITEDKGIRELLSAFRRIKNEGSLAHLLFVGAFDTHDRLEAGRTKQEIELIQDTHVVGYSAWPERYIAISDLLCLPSYREGFGTVVIEAAAMGVPTLGTQIYGLSDAIEHDETGVLVPVRNANALYDAIHILLNDDKKRLQLGEKAKKRVMEKFTAAHVSNLVSLEYQRLLKFREFND